MAESREFAIFLKEFGSEKVYRASEAPKVKMISTGVPSLDYAIGGGIPRGSIVEIFGRESVGKTALSYYIMKETQKYDPDARIGFINLEGSFDGEWASRIVGGLDLTKIMVIAPDPGSEAVKALAMMVESKFNPTDPTGMFDLVVFDSIGAMLTDKEQEKDGNKQVGGQSQLVTHMAKQAVHFANRNKTTVVFLNQVREAFVSMPTMGGPVEKAPGGRSIKHAAAIRIHLKPGNDPIKGKIDGEDVEFMRPIKAKIVKNKVSGAGRSAAWDFWKYDSPSGVIGIDTDQNTIDLALSSGVVEKRGSWFFHDSFPDGKFHGGDAVLTFLEENEDARALIRAEVLKPRAVEVAQELLDEITDDSVRELASATV